MQLMVIILKRYDVLDPLLAAYAEFGVTGATILDSKGMAQELAIHHDDEEFLFLGSLRKVLNTERETSKTILMVVKDDQVEGITKITNEVVGDLRKPNMGILFSLPIGTIYGGRFND